MVGTPLTSRYITGLAGAAAVVPILPPGDFLLYTRIVFPFSYVLGIIIALSSPLADRPYFLFCSSFAKELRNVLGAGIFILFFVPFNFLALLFSLRPSRNSDPGSHSRLFPPDGGPHLRKNYVCYGGRAQIVQTNTLVGIRA